MSSWKDSKLEMLLKKLFTPARAITLGFLLVIFIGAFFLCLPISHNNGQWFNFTDALFTATSCVCVTGLAVVDTATEFSLFGRIILLLLIQIGGLGFMTMTTVMFIVFGKKINLKNRMFMQESVSEDNLKGVVRLAQRIVLYTFIFEGLGAFILAFQFVKDFGVGEGIFVSIFMSVSAFCNAGFDLMGAKFAGASSLVAYNTNPLVLITIALLIIIGGIGFAVIADIALRTNRKNKRLRTHTKVVLWVTFALIFIGTWMFFGFEFNNPNTIGNMSVGNKLLNSFFQAVTPRTAGFASIYQEAMTVPSLGLTMGLMFIGASPAGTGGGIKTTTFIILLFYLWAAMRGNNELVIDKKEVTINQFKKATTIVTMAILVITGAITVVSIAELGNPLVNFEKIMFECISAFSTVGLSLGITASLSTVSKLTLGLVMLIGRIGPITMGWALVKKLSKIQDNIRYPHSDIMVG